MMIVSSKSQIKTLSGGFAFSTDGASLSAERVGLVFCCRLPRAFPLVVGVDLTFDV